MKTAGLVAVAVAGLCWLGVGGVAVGEPTPVIFDNDGNSDDLLALLLLAKLPQVKLLGVTLNANSWGDATGVDNLYDLLAMMGLDDVPVGLGPLVPLADARELLPVNPCRYRQSIPPGLGGWLDVNTGYGVLREMLPRSGRSFVPREQASALDVMREQLRGAEEKSVVLLATGSMTAVAELLDKELELARGKLKAIYIMGGSIEASGLRPNFRGPGVVFGDDPTEKGNLFSVPGNDVAEFNIYVDPHAAKKVIENGVVPIYLVPLDATDRVPLSEAFFRNLTERHHTPEAEVSFKMLRMAKDTWFSPHFYEEYFAWDQLAAAAIADPSVVEFVEGRVEVEAPLPAVVEGNTVPAKQTTGNTFLSANGSLIRYARSGNAEAFYRLYLSAMNSKERSAVVTKATQFPNVTDERIVPLLPVDPRPTQTQLLFDGDMAEADLVALLYLLKVPRDELAIRGVTVAANGRTLTHVVDWVYDLLHMMGRDDVAVGLGAFFAQGESYPPFHSTGSCRYSSYVSQEDRIAATVNHGLYRRFLPRAPRWFTSTTLTDPTDVMVKALNESKNGSVTILVTGPLTNVAKLLEGHHHLAKAKVKEIVVAGGALHVAGNLPSTNRVAEVNMFLDPVAAKAVVESGIPVTLVPLDAVEKVTPGDVVPHLGTTPEADLVRHTLQADTFSFAEPVAASHVVAPKETTTVGVEVHTDGLHVAGWTEPTPSAKHQVKVVRSPGNFVTDVVQRLNSPVQSAVTTRTTQIAKWGGGEKGQVKDPSSATSPVSPVLSVLALAALAVLLV